MPSAVFFAAMILGFLVGTPYALLDYAAFSEGVLFDIQHLASGHGPDLGAAWIYHATRTLPAGLGVPICLAAIVGVVALVKQRWRDALIVLVFCAALYGSMANGRTVFFRYVLPLVPAICLSAAAGVRWAAVWLAARTRLAPATVAAVAAVAVAATASVNSVRLDQLLSRTDTRVLAGSWLAAQVKPDESVYDSGEQGYQRVFLGNVRAHIWRIGTSDVAAKIFLEPGRPAFPTGSCCRSRRSKPTPRARRVAAAGRRAIRPCHHRQGGLRAGPWHLRPAGRVLPSDRTVRGHSAAGTNSGHLPQTRGHRPLTARGLLGPP